MNKPVMQEREPELLVEERPPIQAHATFQSAGELATVTRMEKPAATPLQSDPVSLMEVITRMATNPDFDIAKFDRLVKMQQDAEIDRRRQAFNVAMKDCQNKMKPIGRDADNTQTHSKYATLGKINGAMVPIYTENGFFVSFGTDEPKVEKHYGVTALVGHDGGFERTYRVDIPIDIAGIKDSRNKTDTHGFGSTMSYARRYLLLLIFNIATKDDDGNAASGGKKTDEPKLITPEQVETLQKRLVSLGVDVPKFFHNFAIERLEDLGVPQFTRAMQLLDQREKAAQVKDPSGTLRKQLQDSVAQTGGRAR